MDNSALLRILSPALCAAALIGCKPASVVAKGSYADVNIAELQRSFGCSAPAGAAVEACRLLQNFSTASSFSHWPTGGSDAWVGMKYCKEGPETTGVAALYLRPGTGKMLGAIEVPDAARLLPFGGQYSVVIAGNLADWRGPLSALKEGHAPSLMNDTERANWTLISKPPTDSFHSLVKTDGASFHNWSPGQKLYGREAGALLLMVEYYQVEGSPSSPCIAELARLLK